MSRTVFIKSNRAGTGCGCLVLILLLIVIVVRALWKLLPYVIIAYILWQLWFYFASSNEPSDRQQHSGSNQDTEIKQSIVRDSQHRRIKEAEVIEDDSDK